MDIVAATFKGIAEADTAASQLASEVHVEPDLVTVAPIDDLASHSDHDDGSAEAVLVAWVPEEKRALARDTIGRHHGHHVPIAWALTISRRIGARVFLHLG